MIAQYWSAVLQQFLSISRLLVLARLLLRRHKAQLVILDEAVKDPWPLSEKVLGGSSHGS